MTTETDFTFCNFLKHHSRISTDGPLFLHGSFVLGVDRRTLMRGGIIANAIGTRLVVLSKESLLNPPGFSLHTSSRAESESLAVRGGAQVHVQDCRPLRH